MRRTGVAMVCLLVAVGTLHAGGVPRRRVPLLAWLKAGVYRDTFTPEPAVRASQSAHGAWVRTWYSPELVAALRVGTGPFPRGVAMVKELYGDDPDTIDGHSVMVKVRRRSGRRGQGWFWYETLDDRTPIAIGRGVGLCSGCHAAGTDFLRSDFRP